MGRRVAVLLLGVYVPRSTHRKHDEKGAKNAARRNKTVVVVAQIFLRFCIPQIVALCQQMIDWNLLVQLCPLLLTGCPGEVQRNLSDGTQNTSYSGEEYVKIDWGMKDNITHVKSFTTL